MSCLPKSDLLLPLLFGLHTILNDDDSEIRNLASQAISHVLRTSIVPQAATSAFVARLSEQYWDSQPFFSYIVKKMTGTSTDALDRQLYVKFTLKDVQSQYKEASVGDNKLFAQEKQNLWLDELEDAKVWAVAFSKIKASQFGLHSSTKPLHPILAELISWVKAAALVLSKASSNPDNSLGWATKPDVFVVMMRTIIAINTVVDYLEDHFLVAISQDPIAWGQKGTKLKDDIYEINDFLAASVARSVAHSLHPVLIQAVMKRLQPRERSIEEQGDAALRSSREEIRDVARQQFKNHLESYKPIIGDLSVKTLNFPLVSGSRS